MYKHHQNDPRVLAEYMFHGISKSDIGLIVTAVPD